MKIAKKGAALLALCMAVTGAPLMAGETSASHAEAHEHAGHHMAATPEAALAAYREALVALDLEAAGAVFAEKSSIFENGKPESDWANYAAKHLGPELGHFHSFSFPAHKTEIRVDGDYAFGEERCTYRIELHDGRVIERDGVATSVLRKTDHGWKIVVYHSSGRPPKRS